MVDCRGCGWNIDDPKRRAWPGDVDPIYPFCVGCCCAECCGIEEDD